MHGLNVASTCPTSSMSFVSLVHLRLHTLQAHFNTPNQKTHNMYYTINACKKHRSFAYHTCCTKLLHILNMKQLLRNSRHGLLLTLHASATLIMDAARSSCWLMAAIPPDKGPQHCLRKFMASTYRSLAPAVSCCMYLHSTQEPLQAVTYKGLHVGKHAQQKQVCFQQITICGFTRVLHTTMMLL